MLRKILAGAAIAVLALHLMACEGQADHTYAREGDHPGVREMLQQCVDSGGQAFLNSTQGYAYVYCIHRR